MVHLGVVPTDKAIEQKLVPGIGDLDLNAPPEEDEVTASVYGSRFAAADLPKHVMPDNMMPKEVAYRMIKCVIPPPRILPARCNGKR